ncbi:MAG: DsbC family protein [Syntrophales bacterium]
MMLKKSVILFAVTAILLVVYAGAEALTPEESLKKNFPGLSFDGFRPCAVKGLYEVTAGTQIYYYSPEAEILILGEMVTKDRRNLTRERKLEVITGKIKEIPLEKALKIGSGKNQVIEFSDPDCSFCRKASEFLAKRVDVTRYVFFFPLSERSEKKIRYILCSRDSTKAYKEAYEGKLDEVKFETCKDEKVEEMLKAHRETGRRLGLEGTPFFFINGKAVSGANLPLIEKLLEEK